MGLVVYGFPLVIV